MLPQLYSFLFIYILSELSHNSRLCTAQCAAKARTTLFLCTSFLRALFSSKVRAPYSSWYHCIWSPYTLRYIPYTLSIFFFYISPRCYANKCAPHFHSRSLFEVAHLSNIDINLGAKRMIDYLVLLFHCHLGWCKQLTFFCVIMPFGQINRFWLAFYSVSLNVPKVLQSTWHFIYDV